MQFLAQIQLGDQHAYILFLYVLFISLWALGFFIDSLNRPCHWRLAYWLYLFSDFIYIYITLRDTDIFAFVVVTAWKERVKSWLPLYWIASTTKNLFEKYLNKISLSNINFDTITYFISFTDGWVCNSYAYSTQELDDEPSRFRRKNVMDLNYLLDHILSLS